MDQFTARDGDRRPEDAFSLLALWHALLRRRSAIAWSVGACLAASLLISVVMPRKFAAESRLLVNAEDVSSLEVSDAASRPDPEYAVTLATQADVLGSDTLALQVVHQLSLEEIEKQRSHSWLLPDSRDAGLLLEQSPERCARMLKRFHSNLKVHVVGGTRLLSVRYMDRDPELAAAVVNALVNDYVQQYFQTRYVATRQASEWLSGQLSELKNDVELSQQRMVEYQKQTGLLGESETNNIVMSKLEEINRQVSAAEANRIIKEAVWKLAQSGDPELISSVAGSSFVQGVSAGTNSTQLGLLPTLRAQEAQLKSEIAETALRVGPSFPKLVQMRSQLAELRASIQDEVARISARAENDYLAARNAENMERALLEEQKQEANKLNSSAIEYGILKREVDARRDLYQSMQAKLKQASVLAGLRSSNIVVVDPARVAARAATPNYALNLTLGLGIGLLGGLGLALVHDATDRKLHSPADVRRHTGMVVAGVIPDLARNANFIDAAEERFRALRTSLLLENPSPKVLVVASALAGEGKTTVSGKLARAFFEQGCKVLLVDADLRKPSVQINPETGEKAIGLTAMLISQSHVGGEFRGEGIQAIPSGEEVKHAAELIGTPKMASLILEWRENFDVVILDTPPLLAFSDAVILARHADAVLLVVRAHSTSSDSAQRALETLASARVNRLLPVLNGMDFHSAAYSQYYGHRYLRPCEERFN